MVDDTKENGMNKFQLWVFKHTPAWVVKEGDPHGTVARMILVVLSFGPAISLLVFLYIGIAYF